MEGAMSDHAEIPANAEDNAMLYNVENHVATITFNRPKEQNTISGPMLHRFSELLLEADQDVEVRAIIVTGSGKFFCAGLDLRGSDITNNLADTKRRSPSTLDLRNTPPTVLHNIDTPTIAALNGSAAGYGMDLALGCDIRIMADTAKLAAAFTARGVVPESGGTWILPRLIGWSKASEIIFTGKTLLAQECAEMGLVSHVVNNNEVGARALEMALQIASMAPLAVQSSKRMMRMSMNETFNDHVHHVFLQLLPLFQSDDFKEGMASFMEKRDADFRGH
jgi:enoyl-CoA hydratase/carnithine racemase